MTQPAETSSTQGRSARGTDCRSFSWTSSAIVFMPIGHELNGTVQGGVLTLHITTPLLSDTVQVVQ